MGITGGCLLRLQRQKGVSAFCTARQIDLLPTFSQQTVTTPQVRGRDGSICHTKYVLDSPGRWGPHLYYLALT